MLPRLWSFDSNRWFWFCCVEGLERLETFEPEEPCMGLFLFGKEKFVAVLLKFVFGG